MALATAAGTGGGGSGIHGRQRALPGAIQLGQLPTDCFMPHASELSQRQIFQGGRPPGSLLVLECSLFRQAARQPRETILPAWPAGRRPQVESLISLMHEPRASCMISLMHEPHMSRGRSAGLARLVSPAHVNMNQRPAGLCHAVVLCTIALAS